MTASFNEMLEEFEQTHQTVIEIEDFDEDVPRTEVNVVIRKGDAAMIVRIGWGSLGLHADVYGYRHDEPIETSPVQAGDQTTVYVRD
jgi:hypothetical protein